MKHTGFIAAIIAGGVALTAGSALAQKPGGMHRALISFETMDRDGNGEITQQEFETRHEARFAAADGDGDGMLSREEMILAGQKRLEERVDAMIERFDEDLDGLLSQTEVPEPRKSKRADRHFERMDQDDSGSISKAEYDEARDHMGRHGKGKWQKN